MSKRKRRINPLFQGDRKVCACWFEDANKGDRRSQAAMGPTQEFQCGKSDLHLLVMTANSWAGCQKLIGAASHVGQSLG